MALGFGVEDVAGVSHTITLTVIILLAFFVNVNAIRNGVKRRKKMNEKNLIKALDSVTALLNTLSDTVIDLQRKTIDLHETQLAIVAALALKGVSIKSQAVQELLNGPDPSTH